jgi:hypothetical protein
MTDIKEPLLPKEEKEKPDISLAKLVFFINVT